MKFNKKLPDKFWITVWKTNTATETETTKRKEQIKTCKHGKKKIKTRQKAMKQTRKTSRKSMAEITTNEQTNEKGKWTNKNNTVKFNWSFEKTPMHSHMAVLSHIKRSEINKYLYRYINESAILIKKIHAVLKQIDLCKYKQRGIQSKIHKWNLKIDINQDRTKSSSK